jgi:hypothetical protein
MKGAQKMLKTLISLLTIATLLSLPNTSFALRCGSDVVDVGDLKIEVQVSCGQPFSKESIGYIDQLRYTDQGDGTDNTEPVERIRVMSVEEWIIKDKNNYYSLVFEGNTLKTIEWAVRE